MESLQRIHQMADNVNLTIKAFNCDSFEARGLQKAIFDRIWFQNLCVRDRGENRPVVYVNSPRFYFNITKSLAVEDVVFDGINAFGNIMLDRVQDPYDSAVSMASWTERLCELDTPNAFQVSASNTPLLQLIQDENRRPNNSTFMKGYGYLPLRSLHTEEIKRKTINKDREEVEEHYKVLCQYRGNKVNLFTNGSFSDFDVLIADQSPAQNNSGSASFEFEDRARKSQGQNDQIYTSQEYNDFDYKYVQPDAAKQDRNGYPHIRRRTLFNVYPTMFADSSQRAQNEQGEMVLDEDYMIPTLKLTNVEVKNFLHDYEALIYVESDNLIVEENKYNQAERKIIHFGDAMISSAITISRCEVYDSSFSLGMIFIPVNEPVFIDDKEDIYYVHSQNQNETYTYMINKMHQKSQQQERLIIQDSRLQNLNYGQVVHNLGARNRELNPFAQTTGIVATLNDVKGQLEIVNNTISNNMVFIPSAILSNHAKVNSSLFNPQFDAWLSKETDSQPFGSHLKFHARGRFGTVLNLLNYLDPVEWPSSQHDYVSQSTIYIKSSQCDEVIITNNTFNSNIGIHGGTLLIENWSSSKSKRKIKINTEERMVEIHKLEDKFHNAMDGSKDDSIASSKQQKPMNSQGAETVGEQDDLSTKASSRQDKILIKDNIFDKNMAYLEGNAIHIYGTQDMQQGKSNLQHITNIEEKGTTQILIDNCRFERSYGLNVAIGAAISIDGGGNRFVDTKYYSEGISNISDTAKYNSIQVKNSNFTQNYAGQRASSINIVNIAQSMVLIENNSFSNNTGAYSMFEEEHGLPFHEVLCMKRHKANFFTHVNDKEECMDEISQIGWRHCIRSAPSVEAHLNVSPFDGLHKHFIHYQYPSMQGAIYLKGLSFVEITQNSFRFNGPGPVFDNRQTVGMIKNYQATGHVLRASTIFVDEEVFVVKIHANEFNNNTLNFMHEFILNNNAGLHSFFPPDYFNRAFSPLINIHMAGIQTDGIKIDVESNRFLNQRNSQVSGLAQFNISSMVTTYSASIIESSVHDHAYILRFHKNTVFNFQFIGEDSHLISIALRGALRAEDNSFIEIGQPPQPAMTIDEANEVHVVDQTVHHIVSQVTLLPNGRIPPDQDLQFTNDPIIEYTADAIFHFSNVLKAKGQMNVIKGNYFRRVYGRKAAIYDINQAYKYIKYNIEDNFYHEIFGGFSAIVYVNQKEEFTTQFDLQNYVYVHPQGIGLIKIQNEQVIESQASEQKGALYVLDAKWPLMALIMNNVTLIQIKQRILHAHRVTTYLKNVIVDYQGDQLQRLLSESDQRLQRTGADVTSNFVQLIREDKYFKVLLDETGAPSLEKHTGQVDESKTSSTLQPSSEPNQRNNTSDKVQSSMEERQLFDGIDQQNQWAASHRREFRDHLQLGEEIGLHQIFEGFEMSNRTIAGMAQFLNCSLQNIGTWNTFDEVIRIHKNQVYFRNLKISNIQTLMFKQLDNSVLVIEDSQFRQIGTDIQFVDPVNRSFNISLETIGIQAEVEKKAGGLIRSQQSNLQLINSTFYDFKSSYGLIRATENQDILIDQCKFDNIIGVDQSALLFLIENMGGKVIIQNSAVTNTISKSSLLSINFSQIDLINSSFIGNYAELIANGISMINSKSKIIDCYISNNQNNMNVPQKMIENVISGFINLNYKSQIEIKHTKIQDLQAQLGGFMTAIAKSQIKISDNSVIQNITGSEHCIYIVTSTYLDIKQTSFINTNNMHIGNMVRPNQFSITDTNFEFHGHRQKEEGESTYALEIQNSVGVVSNCKFTKYSSLLSGLVPVEVGGISIKGSRSELAIIDSTFSNLNATKGAAIWIDKQNYTRIQGCTFENNRAEIGGSIYILDSEHTVFVQNTFSNNQAIPSTPDYKISLVQDRGKYTGGAIMISNRPRSQIYDGFSDSISKNHNRTVIFKDGNTFKSNYASIQGGAISYSSLGFQNESIITFEDNKALTDQNDVSSYAHSIEIKYGYNTQRFQMIDGSDFQNKYDEYRVIGEYVEIPSGQMVNIEVHLLDRDGQLLDYENMANAILQVEPMGSYYDTTQFIDRHANDKLQLSLQNYQAQAVNGTLNFTDLIITQPPDSFSVLTFHVENLAANGIAKSFQIHPPSKCIYSRKCISGEYLSTNGECRVCEYGFYLIVPPETITSCIPCNINGQCFGGNKLSPTNGYQRISLKTDNIMKCFNADACLAGKPLVEGQQANSNKIDNILGICGKGYEGLLCNVCAEKYSKTTWKYCARCPAWNFVIVQAISRLLWLTVLIQTMVYLVETISESNDKQYVDILNQITLLINYCIIMAAIHNIEYNWTDLVSRILSIEGLPVHYIATNIKFNCLLLGPSQAHADTLMSFHRTLILTCLSPLLITAWFFIIYFVKNLTSNKKIRYQRLAEVFIMASWLYQPDIARVISASFACTKIDGEYRLIGQTDIICYEGEHKWMMIFVAVPGLLVWIVGFPIILYSQLKKNRSHITMLEHKASLTKLERMENEEFCRRYGFLFFGLKAQHYHWNIIVIAGRCLFIFSTQFLKSISMEFESLISILLIVIAIIKTLYVSPFAKKDLNQSTIFGMLIQLLIMYYGMFFIQDSTNEGHAHAPGDDLIFIPLMIIPGFVFWLRWVAKIRVDVLMIILNKNRRLFRILTIGLVDHNKFIRDYNQNIDCVSEQEEEMRASNTPYTIKGEHDWKIENQKRKDEEIVEEGNEEAGSTGQMSIKKLRRLLGGKDETIMKQSDEIADLKAYIKQLQDMAASSMLAQDIELDSNSKEQSQTISMHSLKADRSTSAAEKQVRFALPVVGEIVEEEDTDIETQPTQRRLMDSEEAEVQPEKGSKAAGSRKNSEEDKQQVEQIAMSKDNHISSTMNKVLELQRIGISMSTPRSLDSNSEHMHSRLIHKAQAQVRVVTRKKQTLQKVVQAPKEQDNQFKQVEPERSDEQPIDVVDQRQSPMHLHSQTYFGQQAYQPSGIAKGPKQAQPKLEFNKSVANHSDFRGNGLVDAELDAYLENTDFAHRQKVQQRQRLQGKLTETLNRTIRDKHRAAIKADLAKQRMSATQEIKPKQRE